LAGILVFVSKLKYKVVPQFSVLFLDREIGCG